MAKLMQGGGGGSNDTEEELVWPDESVCAVAEYCEREAVPEGSDLHEI